MGSDTISFVPEGAVWNSKVSGIERRKAAVRVGPWWRGRGGEADPALARPQGAHRRPGTVMPDPGFQLRRNDRAKQGMRMLHNNFAGLKKDFQRDFMVEMSVNMLCTHRL